MADISYAIGLPPTETVRAFETRGVLQPTVRWSEMLHEEHQRAFTVAKIARLDLLDTMRSSLDDVIRNGGTFEQWKSGIMPDLEKHGWIGTVRDKELTGTSRPVFVGERRLRTIFDTNIRMSRAAGQWARIQELKDVAPYLRYSAVMDDRTRPLHRQWHGTILPVDHPWWDTHFPPCGWRCRCTVIQLSARDLKRRGWAVTPTPPEGPPRTFWPAGKQSPILVPAGIDPGFDYNPGKGHLRALAETTAAKLERAAATDIDAARRTLEEIVDSPAFELFMNEPDSAFPVMILDDDMRAIIQAEARVARMSTDTYLKQVSKRDDVKIREYRQLPRLAASPTLIFQQDDQRIILVRTTDHRWLKAAVKATVDRSELYVVSFQWADARELRRLRRLYPVIYDAGS